jgi:hypothetical protein
MYSKLENNIAAYYINAGFSIRYRDRLQKIQSDENNTVSSSIKIRNPFSLEETNKLDSSNESKLFLFEASYVLNKHIDNTVGSILKMSIYNDAKDEKYINIKNKKLFNYNSRVNCDRVNDDRVNGDRVDIYWHNSINIKHLLYSFIRCKDEDITNFMFKFQYLYYDLDLNLKMIPAFFMIQCCKRQNEYIQRQIEYIEKQIEYIQKQIEYNNKQILEKYQLEKQLLKKYQIEKQQLELKIEMWTMRFHNSINDRENKIYEFIQQQNPEN